MNEQNDCDTSHQTYICMPVTQTNGICMQCNILLKQNKSTPMKHFCKEQLNEKCLIVGNKFHPISCGPHVHFGRSTKFKALIAYFVESKQQDDSFHLFTIIKRNK